MATDEHRRAQIGKQNLTTEPAQGAEEFSRERTRTDTNEEEVAADQRRKAQIGKQNLTTADTEGTEKEEQEFTAKDAKSAKTEELDASEAAEAQKSWPQMNTDERRSEENSSCLLRYDA